MPGIDETNGHNGIIDEMNEGSNLAVCKALLMHPSGLAGSAAAVCGLTE